MIAYTQQLTFEPKIKSQSIINYLDPLYDTKYICDIGHKFTANSTINAFFCSGSHCKRRFLAGVPVINGALKGF